MSSPKLSFLVPPVKPEASASLGLSGGYFSPGSTSSRRSSFNESSDEEDRVSVVFPGEKSEGLGSLFASYFGSPYRGGGRVRLVREPRDTPSESMLSSITNHFYDFFGLRSERERIEQQAFKASETAIIFDWDDTLFPTWHVIETLKENLCADAAFHKSLKKLSESVKDLLRLAKTCGQVAIVTLSRRPWVSNSASEYMPGLDIEGLLKELRIPVIYSRECVKPYMMRSPDDFEEGVCPLQMAKEQAMKKALRKLYGKKQWKNVLSIGDSVTEREAITELLWAYEGDSGASKSCCKTLKMLQDPSIEQLQQELDVIKEALPGMATRGEDFSFFIDERGAIAE